MSFIAPLMLIGIAGAAIPIVIHMLGRRRARLVRFAAIDFLLGSDKRLARHLRLREFLLLFLRVLVCVAAAAVLSKPYTSCDAHGPVVERGPQATVLLIDDSLTSRYQLNGSSLLSRAKKQARSILAQLGPEADVAVFRISDSADPPSELTRNHLEVRDAIDHISPSWRPGDASSAIRHASQLLQTSPHENKAIYLLSGMAAASFSETAVALAPSTRLHVIDLAEDHELPNIAITSVEVKPDPDVGSRGIQVIVEVANFSSRPIAEHEVSLKLGDDVVAKGLVSIAAGDRTRKRFTAVFPSDERSTNITAAIEDDPLRADNERYVVAERREQIPILLVNGDPRTVRHEDELFYLETALRPGDRGDSGNTLTRATVEELDEAELEEFDVIILANCHALESDVVGRLSDWVASGGGLIISTGDNVDPDDYNQRMLPLLPQKLQSVLDTTHGRSIDRADPALQLHKLEADHPIFSIFAVDAPGLLQARFNKVMLLGPTTEVEDRRVLARFSNGAVALVEARSGRGQLLLFTSSFDRDWNDLVIHPGFLPLVQQAIRHLARKPYQRVANQLLVGQSTTLHVGDSDVRLRVDMPGNEQQVIEGEQLAQHVQVRFARTDRPGFYSIEATDTSGKTLDRPEASFAVNVDPQASNLARLDPTALATPTDAASAPQGESPATHKRRVELWHSLALALLLVLGIESLVSIAPRLWRPWKRDNPHISRAGDR